jgi:hypothetical protein
LTFKLNTIFTMQVYQWLLLFRNTKHGKLSRWRNEENKTLFTVSKITMLLVWNYCMPLQHMWQSWYDLVSFWQCHVQLLNGVFFLPSLRNILPCNCLIFMAIMKLWVFGVVIKTIWGVCLIRFSKWAWKNNAFINAVMWTG